MDGRLTTLGTVTDNGTQDGKDGKDVQDGKGEKGERCFDFT